MNITIVKSSTVIELIEDYTYKYRRDGGFHTAQINFYSTDDDLLDIWDLVEVGGVSWRVAEAPRVRINFETSPDWLYTVNLVELAAILDGIPMPNITFTQNAAKTKTFEDALNEILWKVRPYTITNPALRDYTLHYIPGVDLSGIAPDEKFEKMSLYQILKYYAEMFDAKIVLGTTGAISFQPLNDYTATITPTFTQLEKSRSTEEYATDVIMDVENADIGEQATWPAESVIVAFLPADITQDITWENSLLRLPFKIKKVHSIKAFTIDNLMYEQYDAFTVEYGTRVFEKQEWETLEQSTFWSFITNPLGVGSALRSNSVYYEYGGTDILNTKVLEALGTPAAAKDLRFQIEYEPLPDLRIKRSSGVELDGSMKFTKRLDQNGNTVSLAAEGIRLDNEVRNMQTWKYNATWMSMILPANTSRVQYKTGEYALMTLMSIQKVGSYYEINAELSTEYNKRNPLTKVISENRIFEIPKTQTTIRKIIWKTEAKITVLWNSTASGSARWQNYNWHLLLNLDAWTPATTDSHFDSRQTLLFAKFTYNVDSTTVSVYMPTINIQDGNSIFTIARMMSNTAVDYQRSIAFIGSTASAAIITDENGENSAVLFKYIATAGTDVVAEATIPDYSMLCDAFPFVENDFFDDGYFESETPPDGLNVFPLFDTLQIVKDRREQLQFEHEIAIDSESPTVADTDVIIRKSKLMNTDFVTPTLKISIGFVDYDAPITAIYAYAGYVKIEFTVPEDGKADRIDLLLDGEVAIVRWLSSEVVAKRQTKYIAINIE
jgi:hypothetical protein